MCVHTRHCSYERCKYGEEDYCPVYLGYREPEHRQKCKVKPTEKEFKKRRNEAESFYDE